MAIEINGQSANVAAQTGTAAKNTSAQQSFFEVFHRLPESRLRDAGQGVKMAVVREGQGSAASDGARVSVKYTGWLENGKQFDTSLERGEPFTFTLGKGQVIKGWEQGMRGIKPGERRQIVVPAEAAYGERQVGNIPPGSTLVFNVEATAVESGGSPNPKGNHSIKA